MLQQLLNLFTIMFLFNHVVNALQLWNEYRRSMIENLITDNDENAAEI